MRHGKMSRDQVAAIYGDEFVADVDAGSCEPTSRLQTDGDPDTEWVFSKTFSGLIYGDGVDDPRSGDIVTAYYYLDTEQMQVIADHDGDAGAADWHIHGYEVQ